MYFFVLPCSRSRSSDIAYLISLPTSDLQVLKDHVVLVRVFSQIIELHQPHHSASFHYIPSVHLTLGQPPSFCLISFLPSTLNRASPMFLSHLPSIPPSHLSPRVRRYSSEPDSDTVGILRLQAWGSTLMIPQDLNDLQVN